MTAPTAGTLEPPKRRTKGLDLKLPIQAAVTIIVALAAHYGIDIDETVSVAIGVVLGFIAGSFGPAPETYVEGAGARPVIAGEAGQTDPGRVVLWLLVAILILVFLGLLFSLGDVRID